MKESQWFKTLAVSLGAACLAGCAGVSSTPKETVVCKPFGATTDGTAVEIYTLRNSKGAEARISSYGGLLIHSRCRIATGKLGDVTLGYDKLSDYIKDTPYFGALIGRYGNRIAQGQVHAQWSSSTRWLPTTTPTPCTAASRVSTRWSGQRACLPLGRARRCKLQYLSKDGEEGYPGNLSVTAVYTLTEDNALQAGITPPRRTRTPW